MVQSLAQSSPLARATPQQLAFQDLELGVFIHYSIDPYAGRGSIPGSTPASSFNPSKLNVEQWVQVAKSMGASYVVLTARHEQGFCLWPTKTTDYSIKNSPYKSGKGDIVKEFVDACRKYGLKPGLYTAPWIDSHWEIVNNGYKGGATANIDKFDHDPAIYKKALEKEKEQFRELLTNYGPLVFIWNDHFGRSDVLADVPLAGNLRDMYATLTRYGHELQPDCLFLGRDIEHVGNENAKACYPFWNSLNTLDGTYYTVSKSYKWDQCNTGDPLGKLYRPQLAPTTISFSTGGWMWQGPRKPQPIERRMQAYYETIGRGAGLIVNLTPDTTGLIPEDLVSAAKKYGMEIKRQFGNPIASSNAKDPVQTLQFKEPKTINQVVTMEDLQDGQKISEYTIEAQVDGQWKTIVKGKTIGHKRIDQFEPVTASAVRFSVTGSLVKTAVMRSIAVFNNSALPAYQAYLLNQANPTNRALANQVNQLITYPAPNDAVQNSDFSVNVRIPGKGWQELPEYLVKVDEIRGATHNEENSSMSYFDFSGEVEVSVTYNKGVIQNARIRPLSYGIIPEINGSTIKFKLKQARNLSVEVNGDIFHNLQLFANPVETNKPKAGDENVIYFESGIHEIPGQVLKVESGKTVYLAGGAILRGQILIKDAENVKVIGRGMVDQSIKHGVHIANSKNVEINGIFCSQCFTGGSDYVTIRNVKSMSYFQWGDGMNVISSNNVLIDGVFNRNSDDCTTVYGTRLGFTGGCRNITMQNSTLWADVAHPILIGTHGNTPNPEVLENLNYINIDILDHNELQVNYQGCMSLNAGDSNLIRNVRFENIRVEDFRQGQLVNLRIFYNRQYCTSPGRGIENILFKDITYNGKNAELSIIDGYDDDRKVKNVVFENLVINGTVISDDMKVKPAWFKTSDFARFYVGDHTEGIVFKTGIY